MTAPRLLLPELVQASIKDAAEAAYPEECCGLLVGRDEDGDVVVTEAHASANVTDGDPRRSFLVDARLQFDLMRAHRDGPERIVGHYHSHPDGPAEPSEHDRESVFYFDHVWVIVAVTDGRAGIIAAHVFDKAARTFRALALVTESARSRHTREEAPKETLS